MCTILNTLTKYRHGSLCNRLSSAHDDQARRGFPEWKNAIFSFLTRERRERRGPRVTRVGPGAHRAGPSRSPEQVKENVQRAANKVTL